MSNKVAVILFNLGSPDSKEAIKPFLMNFFMDKNIINLPLPFRYMLAKRISSRRSKNEAGDAYGELGNKSPLLENTNAQRDALELSLNFNGGNDYKVFTCMRYWHPFASQVVKDVEEWGADNAILLPLYPQYSTTTTKSSVEDWNKSSSSLGLNVPTSIIENYYDNENFIEASADNILKSYKDVLEDSHENLRILFSAHGLPEKIIKAGDPYQYQCEKSADLIAAKVSEKLETDIDYQICYQSRVGRLKWIGPSIDEALKQAAADKKTVIIYPHAFTQEHVETLVELDIEYKDFAEKLGISGYYRVPTLGISEKFIAGLADLIKHRPLKNKTNLD